MVASLPPDWPELLAALPPGFGDALRAGELPHDWFDALQVGQQAHNPGLGKELRTCEEASPHGWEL